MAEEVGIGYGTCQWVLMKELGMHHVTAKFVPRILTADQKPQCVDICTELCQLASDKKTFLSRVITNDGSWVYGYDPETKQHSSQWKSRPILDLSAKCACYISVVFVFHMDKPRSVSGQHFASFQEFCKIPQKLSNPMNI
jgi:hypothetical protein